MQITSDEARKPIRHTAYSECTPIDDDGEYGNHDGRAARYERATNWVRFGRFGRCSMTDMPPADRDQTEETPEPGSILVPAPILFVPALVLGVVLDRLTSTEARRRPWSIPIGGLLLVTGTAVFIGSILGMRRLDKSPSHEDEPPELLTNGTFRYSRNPIYTGLVGMYVGTTLLIDGSWPFVTVLPVILYLDRVIDSEESFLEAAFGEEFEQYRSDVPRWL